MSSFEDTTNDFKIIIFKLFRCCCQSFEGIGSTISVHISLAPRTYVNLFYSSSIVFLGFYIIFISVEINK